MKQKIKYSTYSICLTVAILLLFIIGVFSLLGNEEKLTLFCIIMGGVTITGLYFCPKYIEANDSCIVLHPLLSSPKVYLFDNIQTVEPCYPSLGGLRLCACGGYFGYWGFFHDFVIGSYIGYYGSRNNCILVKMKDGKQYVLGCEDATPLVDYIKTQLCK